ncbi:MAG TPA: hypothetical protein VFR37_24225 [Longimicrobium sp.]|nr:hypothetical protein [Longimicrobium sp.]
MAQNTGARDIRQFRSARALFRAVASEQVPGFGGLFYEDDGTPVVYLKDVRQGARAQAALDPVLRERRYFGRGHVPGRRTLVVRQGRYDYLELSEWSDRVLAAVAGVPGMFHTGVVDSWNRVEVAVENVSAVQQRLRQAGIPGEVVKVVVARRPEPMIGPPQTVRDTFVTPPGGIRIVSRQSGRYIAGCTLGFNLYDTGTGGRWFATNSHCTPVMGQLDPGTEFHQPYDNLNDPADPLRFFGLEDWDPPFTDTAYHWMYAASCPETTFPVPDYKCRNAELAWVRYPAHVPWDLGGIARPALLNTTDGGDPSEPEPYGRFIALDPVNPTFRIVGSAMYALEGEMVDKVGATSGWSRSRVVRSCTNMVVKDHDKMVICNQKTEGGDISGGDSGSPVFRNHGDGTVTLLGILHSGSHMVAGSPPVWMYSPFGGIINDFPPITGWFRVCADNVWCSW